MKYTLECNEDEEKTFRLHLDGVKWALAMWDLDQKLRDMVKRQDLEVINIEELRENILDLLCDCGLSFDDIE